MIFLEDWVMAFLSGVCAYEAADYGEYAEQQFLAFSRSEHSCFNLLPFIDQSYL